MDGEHPSAAPSVEMTAHSEEIAALRCALEKEKNKLSQWKEKAKAGVDQMRQQVLHLSASLDETRAERDRLQGLIDAVGHGQGSQPSEGVCGGGQASSTPMVKSYVESAQLHCVGAADALLRATLAKTDIMASAAAGLHPLVNSHTHGDSPVGGERAPSSTPGEDIDAYKRRVTMTLKLQTKNCETLQQQVEELRRSITALKDTVAERDRSLANCKETIALLEDRFHTAEQANKVLEEQQAELMRGPNMDEMDAMGERMEQEVAQVRAEYIARENAIFMQHRDEMERMRALAEEELEQARADYEEKLGRAVEQAVLAAERNEQLHRIGPVSDAAASTAASPQMVEDAAYGNLLSEYEALQKRLRDLEDDRRTASATLPSDAAGLTGVSNGQGGDAASNNCRGGGDRPKTLLEANTIIAEQQESLQSLSDQLWKVKRELLDKQRAVAATPVAEKGVLDGQQTVYLRSILVKALCAKGDENVLVNLLPVFSTLLNFDSNDLKHIYQANPSWAARK